MSYGFVYIWYDRKHKRYYVGCHWGAEDDGYICSSSWMKASYKKRPNDFKRRILARVYTNRRDLLQEEYRWLSMMKSEELHGPRYYNLHNHQFNHWSSDEQKVFSVKDKLKAADNTKGICKYWKGREKSESHRKKISSTLKGRPLNYIRTAETCAKLSESSERLQAEGKIGMRGKCHKPETRAKMSKNNAMNNPIHRAKIGEANRGKVALWLNNTKRMAKPNTELYIDLLTQGYKPKERT